MQIIDKQNSIIALRLQPTEAVKFGNALSEMMLNANIHYNLPGIKKSEIIHGELNIELAEKYYRLEARFDFRCRNNHIFRIDSLRRITIDEFEGYRQNTARKLSYQNN